MLQIHSTETLLLGVFERVREVAIKLSAVFRSLLVLIVIPAVCRMWGRGANQGHAGVKEAEGGKVSGRLGRGG